MTFHAFTLRAGAIASRRRHDSRDIGPKASAIFREMLNEHGENFHRPIPVKGLEHIELQWTEQFQGNALATFWARKAPVTTSILLSGQDPESEETTIKAFLSGLIARLYHDSPIEPGIDLLNAKERPLIALEPIPLPYRSADMNMIAYMETCLAAAYFGA